MLMGAFTDYLGQVVGLSTTTDILADYLNGDNINVAKSILCSFLVLITTQVKL